jgi:hypothetical protein
MQRFVWLVSFVMLFTTTMSYEQEAGTKPQEMKIASFESAAELKTLHAVDARVALTSEHATEGQQALRIDFEKAARPRVEFPAGEKPWDWSGHGALAFDVTNPSDEEIGIALRIADAAGDDPHHTFNGHATIGGHQSVSYSYPLGSSTPMEHGMRGGPPYPGIEPFVYTSREPVNEGHVTRFEIYLDHPSAAHTLIVDNIRLLPPISYDGIVDAYGQYTRAGWPGKIHNDAELKQRRDEEEAQIQAAPALPARDEFGGWAEGPQVTPTGFFTTLRRDGKWWLVTPSGHLFFSLGVDAIAVNEGFTLVEGREKMFTWLPSSTDPLAKHFGYTEHVLYGPIKKGRTFNFYTANLERKYGADYLTHWRSTALDRLRAWGFNTIANWSDPALFAQKRVPYTATVDIHGKFARVASGQDYWGKMSDPFDPKFAEAARRSIGEVAPRYRDDPWCLGYFIDNEISWGSPTGTDRQHFGLAYGALAADKDSPAKAAFVDQLRLHYRKIKHLNHAWHTKFASWDALLAQPFEAPETLTRQMRDDFSHFLKLFAQQYFRVVRDALKQYDPNHLYLGCRFAWRTPEAVAAAAEYCDVISFNIYKSHLDPKDWGFTEKLGKPCIIGEFHFGSLDRGMFHPGLVSTPNQAARAAMYQDYIRSVVDNPAFVGCGWFEYVDEPLTGREYDGENYNIGFVTTTDTPYPEMVAAAKAVHAEVYTRRAGK